jgi:glycosyltransferase involved in cell wall biosynthesis
MDTFKPIETIKTTDPTVVMLSNVQFIKGVKTAIMAAGVIINDFGFKNYNLVVYGAQDRQPSYAIESAQMISDLGIGKTVRLGGFGSPREALKDAWLFMNSSLSEGLPLAVGEAALLGIPIVATDVGATAQVLTDVDDPSILYGEVVPPNDPIGLARAQISMLAMVGPWAKFTSDDFAPPPLPVTFTPEDVIWLEQRMHDKMKDRRKLGLRLRDVVIRKFNGTRYLREHEQMYWVQRHMAAQRADTRLINLSASHPRVGETLHLRLVEMEDTNSMWKEQGWQHFGQKVSKMDVVLERLRKNSADHKSEFCEDSKVRKRDSMLGSKIKTSLE